MLYCVAVSGGGGWRYNTKRWVSQARCFRFYPLTLLDLLWRVLGCQKGWPSNDLSWSVYHQLICLGQFAIKCVGQFTTKLFVLVCQMTCLGQLPSNYLSWSVNHSCVRFGDALARPCVQCFLSHGSVLKGEQLHICVPAKSLNVSFLLGGKLFTWII